MKILTFLRCITSNGEEINHTITQLTKKKKGKKKETHNHRTSYFVAVSKELVCSCEWMQKELPRMEGETVCQDLRRLWLYPEP